MARSSKLELSPSLCHRHLVDQIKPGLAFDGGDVRAWRRKLKRRVRARLGMDRMPSDPPPLDVRLLWRRETPLGPIEKVAFQAEPHADVTAYVCLPAESEPPLRTMICLQGHSTGMHNSIGVDAADETAPMDVPGDRDFAIGCMRRGVAAVCVEQRSLGERSEQDQEQVCGRQCQEAAMHALALGRTLIGERVYDVSRAIEYIRTRPELDARRLGVMGNSGGGTITMFAAAVIPEIRAAMPSCYFNTFRDSIMSLYHCECNYVPGLVLDAEMADVMGLFAPKPVVVVAGRDDEIFPIEATRKAFKDLRTIYAAAGAEDNCHLVVGEGGHRFYAEKAWAKMLPIMEAL